MSEGAKVIKLRLSLMGRPLNTYTYDKPVITCGRDPSADISLENPGVSREHFRLERLPDETYQVVDLGSANGTQVNDRNVNIAPLRENDVIRFGKYTLWVSYDQDRRSTGDAKPAQNTMAQNTVVLSREELSHVMSTQRKKEDEAPPAPVAPAARATPAPAAPPPAPQREPASSSAFAIFLAFMGGAAFGLAAMWLALSR